MAVKARKAAEEASKQMQKAAEEAMQHVTAAPRFEHVEDPQDDWKLNMRLMPEPEGERNGWISD